MYFNNVHYQCTSNVLQKKCSFNLHFNVLCIQCIISHILYIGNVHCKCAFQCTSNAHLSIYSYLLYYAHSQGTLPMYITMLFLCTFKCTFYMSFVIHIVLHVKCTLQTTSNVPCICTLQSTSHTCIPMYIWCTFVKSFNAHL